MSRITAFYFNTIVPKLKLASQFAEHLLTSIFNKATGKTFHAAYDKNPRTVKLIGFLGVTALCAKLLGSGKIDHLLGRSNRLKDLSIEDINSNIPLLQSFRERGLSPAEKRTLYNKMPADIIEAATTYPNIFHYDLVLPAEDAGNGNTFQTLAENAVREKQKDAADDFYYYSDFQFNKLNPLRTQLRASVSTFLPSLPTVLFEKGFLQRNNPNIVAFVKKFIIYCRDYYIKKSDLPEKYKNIALHIEEHFPLPANLLADLRTAQAKYNELAEKQKPLYATKEKLTKECNAECARLKADCDKINQAELAKFDGKNEFQTAISSKEEARAKIQEALVKAYDEKSKISAETSAAANTLLSKGYTLESPQVKKALAPERENASKITAHEATIRTLDAEIRDTRLGQNIARQAIEKKHLEEYEKQKKAVWDQVRSKYEAASSEIEKINAEVEANSESFKNSIDRAQF